MTDSANMGDSQKMATVKQLNSLIHLDFDAIDAYDAAIKRTPDAEMRAALLEFRDDHERHTEKLTDWVEQLGGKPATRGDLKAMLTAGKVAMGSLSEAMGILKAMQSNEEETNRKYEDALESISEPAALVTTLGRHLEDERKHKSWIDNQLGLTDEVPYAHRIGPNSH